MKLRYYIKRGLLMTIIMGCIGCQRKAQEEPKVVFQDPIFQAVFDEVGYIEKVGDYSFETIPPTQSQLDKMTALNLMFSKGEECSLEDLQKFPNLRGLLIYNASQSVIQQISEQKQLRALYIMAHEPVDMSPIGTMDNVKALVISAPGEEAEKLDWSFIENMKQLETLEIEHIQLKDLNFVKSLPNLERLSLSNVEIKDISALETLSNLKCFRIYGDRNNDYSVVLKSMNHLEQLSLRMVEITDWSFLKDLKNLKWLSIRNMESISLPGWLIPENYPDLNMLDIDAGIMNTNYEIMEQILPVLEERRNVEQVAPEFHDPKINFPVVLEYMEPIETYDD